MQVTFADKNAFAGDGLHDKLFDTEVNQMKAAANSKADQQDPVFFGIPQAPTPTTTTATNQIATTAWVHSLFNQTIVPSGSIVLDNALLEGSDNAVKSKAVYDFFNPTLIANQNPRGDSELSGDGVAGFWPSTGMYKKLAADVVFTSVKFQAYASSDADITVYIAETDSDFVSDVFIDSSTILASKHYPAGTFNQVAATLVTTDFNQVISAKSGQTLYLLIVKNSGTSLTTYRFFADVSSPDPITNPSRPEVLASSDGNHFSLGGPNFQTDFVLLNKKVLASRVDRAEAAITSIQTSRTLYLDQFGPKANGTSDSVAFQKLLDQIKANGGGSAKVKPLSGSAYGVGRASGPHGMFLTSNSSFGGDGMTRMVMTDNASFITGMSNIASQSVLTADTTPTTRTVSVDDVTEVQIDDDGLLRIGQAGYDAGEPDYFQYCKVKRINGSASPYAAVRVQAKSYSAVSGPSLEQSSDMQKNTQYNLGSWAPTGYAEFQIVIPSTASYTLKFRIASSVSGGTLQVLQDGVAVGTLSVPNTSAVQTFAYATLNVALTAGSRTIRLLNNSSTQHFNLNWFDWILQSAYVASPTLTFDRPVNYALSASSVTRTDHKSWTRFENLLQNVVIENFSFDSPATDPANAEYGIFLYFAKNITIRNIVGRNTGAGLVCAQYIEGLTIENCRQLHTESQDGQASKGRFLSIAECKDVRIINPYLEDYEADGAIIFEAKNFNVEIVNLHANNSFVASDGSVMIRKLFVLLGQNEITVKNMILEGNGHVLADMAFGEGKVRVMGNVYIADGCSCSFDDNWATDFQASIRTGTQNPKYYCRMDTFEAVINVVPNMNVNYDLPAGQYVNVQAGVSDLQSGVNGLKFAGLGTGGQGPNCYLVETVSNTGPITAANKTIRVNTGGMGVGVGINQINSGDSKYLNIQTGANILPGTRLILKVQYLLPEGIAQYGGLVDNRKFINTGYIDFGDTYLQRTKDVAATLYTPANFSCGILTINGAGNGMIQTTPDGLHTYKISLNNSGGVITSLLT